jgi:hypothetical protein
LATGMPDGVHRLQSRAIRSQSTSKSSSSNFKYPSKKGRLEVNRKNLIFKEKELKLVYSRID